MAARKQARLAKQNKTQNKEKPDNAMPVLAELHDLNVFLDGQDSDKKKEIKVVGNVPVEQGRVEDVAAPDDDVDGITGEQDYMLLYTRIS